MHCTESLGVPSKDFLTKSSIIDKPVRVFPEPVGEQRKMFSIHDARL